MPGRAGIAALLAGVLVAGSALAGPPPPPPRAWRDAPTPPARVPPPVYAPVPVLVAPPVRSAPPPLPVAMRVIYAPFYVAGLTVRYGVYYGLVAPLEVFFRTVDYGASGGVGPNPDPNRGP